MTRIVYISGKWRHYWPDESYDDDKMKAEVYAERYWARIVAECGMMWIAPLSNSVFLEGLTSLDGDEFIARDLEIIDRLRPQYDLILMRAGWDEGSMSVGAERELDRAGYNRLLVAYTKHGEEAVRRYLAELLT